MCEPSVGQIVVRLDRCIEIAAVDAARYAHEHVLRSLDDVAVDAQQVRALERLESKVVVLEVAVIDNRTVESVTIGHDESVHIVGDQRRLLLRLGFDVAVQALNDVGKHLARLLVQVGDGDACRQQAIVGVLGAQVRGGLGRQLIEFARRHPLVHARTHLLCDQGRVDKRVVESVAQLLDATRDLKPWRQIARSAWAVGAAQVSAGERTRATMALVSNGGARRLRTLS